MVSTEALRERLAQLRLGFDQSFSMPQVEQVDDTVDLLQIRVARDPYALRLAQLAGLEADRSITPVPSEHAALVGIAGARGRVIAVFDLASLLGLPRPESTRWLVLVKGAPIAFAFSTFEAQFSAKPADLARAGKGGSEIVARDGAQLPLLDLPALVAGLEGRTRRTPGEG